MGSDIARLSQSASGGGVPWTGGETSLTALTLDLGADKQTGVARSVRSSSSRQHRAPAGVLSPIGLRPKERTSHTSVWGATSPKRSHLGLGQRRQIQRQTCDLGSSEPGDCRLR
jgi:hypothetical protein